MMFRKKHNSHWHAGFYDEAWRANVELIWPVDGAQVKEFIKDRFDMAYATDDDWGAKCIELSYQDGDHNLICLRGFDQKNPFDVSMLSHEALHAVEHILGARGCFLVRNSTEPYAYLLESIMLRSLKLLNTRKPIK